MRVCNEVITGQWVSDGEMIVQLGDGVDCPRLNCTVYVFSVLGALGVGQPEDTWWLWWSMEVCMSDHLM